MRTVVTGAFGYLGLALLRKLPGAVAVGHPPRATAPIPAGVEVIHGDLALAAELEADALVHLAGRGGEGEARKDPVAAVSTIVGGTARLAASRARKKLFSSTIAVYGTFRDHGRPYREDDAPRPDDLYGACKRAAEQAWTLGGGTSLRIANIYGAGCGVDLGINGAVERFARAAATGGDITIYGEGAQRIDYVHVDDVCAAIHAALAADTLPPALNIGSGRPVSIRELAEACVRAGEALGQKPRIVSLPPPEGKVWPDRSLSIDLARSTLGWQPRVALDDGIRELVTMMRKS